MRLFLTKSFSRWFRASNLDEQSLKIAASEVAGGRVEASLGGGLYKKRIGRKGVSGKRGGYRTIIAFRLESHVFLLFGFAKQNRTSVDEKELKALKESARVWLAMKDAELDAAISRGALRELRLDKDE